MSRLIDDDMLKSAIARYSEKLLSHKNLSIVKNAIREVLGDINFAIDIQPTIDAVPVVHAHWIGKPLAGYSTVKCSACGSVFVENNGKWKYCPDCGAKMDEVTE